MMYCTLSRVRALSLNSDSAWSVPFTTTLEEEEEEEEEERFLLGMMYCTLSQLCVCVCWGWCVESVRGWRVVGVECAIGE
jgi:hypothetical protein